MRSLPHCACRTPDALKQASRVRFHPDTKGFGDRGYQGIGKFHPNSQTPKTKPTRLSSLD
ncbi:hypothetical protein H6F66_07695 [Trichocoleus sp. FACHB-6]|nr:hypothetical protein [Trichocoleus sp. FACHB-6]MBD2062159.1 hypothetical protein [Trichocoleus sp. FACHB-6]